MSRTAALTNALAAVVLTVFDTSLPAKNPIVLLYLAISSTTAVYRAYNAVFHCGSLRSIDSDGFDKSEIT